MRGSLKYLTDLERSAIEQFAALVRTALGGNLIEMELFGSKVRGDFTGESDIDILILVKDKTPDVMDKVGDIAAEMTLQYDIPLSPVVFSEYEYEVNENISSPFILNVEAEGVSL